MKEKSSSVSYMLAIVIGVVSISLVYWQPIWGYIVALTLFILFSLVYSYRVKRIPWALIFLLLISNYIAGIFCFCIPGWGNLLPIDLIFIIFYWGIIGLVGRIGIYFGNKYAATES